MSEARIDLARVRRAMKRISVSGLPNTNERRAAIAEVIARIQSNGDIALLDQYVGIKNYAHFGDQRSDHPYGYGPTHGAIVFRICRTAAFQKEFVVLGPDEIYALECLRDFPGLTVESRSLADIARFSTYRIETYGFGPESTFNLFSAIQLLDALAALSDKVGAELSKATVESHEAAA